MTGDTAVFIRLITILVLAGLVIGITWVVVIRLLDWPAWLLFADGPIAFYLGYKLGNWYRKGGKE